MNAFWTTCSHPQLAMIPQDQAFAALLENGRVVSWGNPRAGGGLVKNSLPGWMRGEGQRSLCDELGISHQKDSLLYNRYTTCITYLHTYLTDQTYLDVLQIRTPKCTWLVNLCSRWNLTLYSPPPKKAIVNKSLSVYWSCVPSNEIKWHIHVYI